MATKLKERASFFSAGEQEMIMNAYEEHKTIFIAKTNTDTAARARQEAVYGAVYAGISTVCMYRLRQVWSGTVVSAVG